MVFYFATPRRGESRAQGGEGRKDRQRTAPSMFVYYVLAPATVLFSLLVTYIPVVGNLVNDYLDGQHTSTKTVSDGPPAPLRIKDRIPIRLPNVMICFRGRPNGDALDILDKWELEPERISNIKKEVFLLKNPTIEHFEEIMSLSGLDNTVRPPADYISPAAIPSLLEIINGLSLVTRCFWMNFNEAIKVDLAVAKRDIVTGTATGTTTPGDGDEEMEEGEHVESPTLVRIGGEEPAFTLSAEVDSEEVYTPWGSIEMFLENTSSGGIMCPFERNFAAPDPHAVKELITSYPWIFAPSSRDSADLDNMMSYWITEISSTMCGMVISHMIVSLKLAERAGKAVYFIQVPDKHYDGSIIVGQDFKVGGPGIATVSAGTQSELEQELKEYGFHTETLRKILLECGLSAVSPNSVKTMRHLREMVYAGTGAPTGVTQNKLMKWLPVLSFAEKPLGVNMDAVKTIINLLADSDGDIPRDLFLPTECFFTPPANRTQLIICAWGNNPPTFNYSGKPLLATAQKGIGAGNVGQYDVNPPRILQMKRVAMLNAVSGWNTMLEKGYIWGEYTVRTSQSRQFQGKEKVELWRFFNEVLSGTVRVPGGLIEMRDETAPRGSKRAQTDDGEERAKTKKSRLFRK